MQRRLTKESIEESVIDHVLKSKDLEEDLNELKIDEEHILNKIIKTKKGITKVNSDHNVLISKFNMKWKVQQKRERIEMFNLKNRDAQKQFRELTSNNDNLSSILCENSDINVTTKKFLKKLDACIYKCFTKIRIVDRPDVELDALFSQRKILRNKTDEACKGRRH